MEIPEYEEFFCIKLRSTSGVKLLLLLKLFTFYSPPSIVSSVLNIDANTIIKVISSPQHLYINT